MTEEEAKTKWCPFARVSCASGPETGNHAANRTPTGLHNESSLSSGSFCIGSACMAWREEKTFKPTHVGVVGTRENPEYELGGEIRKGGYCGLAGKP